MKNALADAYNMPNYHYIKLLVNFNRTCIKMREKVSAFCHNMNKSQIFHTFSEV